MDDEEKESTAFVSRKAKEAISDVLQEWGQLALEAMRSDNVLDRIPAVKTVAAFAKAAIGIKDRIFTRKLEKFLTGLSDVAPDERREMVRRLEADPAYGRKIGEHIIELLDRIESHRKPSMLGAAFAAFAARQIDETMLHRLSAAIDRLPTIEIDTVRKFANSTLPQERQRIDPLSLQGLANAGLLTPGSAFGGTAYDLNRIGETFVTLDLDVKSKEPD